MQPSAMWKHSAWDRCMARSACPDWRRDSGAFRPASKRPDRREESVAAKRKLMFLVGISKSMICQYADFNVYSFARRCAFELYLALR